MGNIFKEVASRCFLIPFKVYKKVFMVLSCLGVKIENGDRFFVLLLWPVVVALGTFWFPNCISAKITTMQDQHYYYNLKRK